MRLMVSVDGSGTPLTFTLSIAHHQSLPASKRPNVNSISLAPAGLDKAQRYMLCWLQWCPVLWACERTVDFDLPLFNPFCIVIH